MSFFAPKQKTPKSLPSQHAQPKLEMDAKDDHRTNGSDSGHGTFFNLRPDAEATAQTEPSDMSEAVNKFLPANACWQRGAVPYAHLAAALELLNTTTKRLEKAAHSEPHNDSVLSRDMPTTQLPTSSMLQETILANCFRSMLALGATSEVQRGHP